MQFETRIVNGKPSIFYKDDIPKSTSRKINTKDKLAKKEIQRSMEVNGEIDTVKPSPRQIDLKNSKTKTTSINSVLNKNGINLTPEQLMSLINAIKSPETNTDNQKAKNKASKTNSLENLNEDFYNRPNKSNYIRPVDDMNMSAYRQPQVVVYEEPETNIKKSISLEQLNSNQKVSLVEKKKLKWQQDKEMLEKLNQQEVYDIHKYTSPTQQKAPSVQPRAIQTPEPPAPPPPANFFKNTMTLAEKKRLQWQQEKDNKEDLNKFYTSEKDLVNLKQTNPDSNKLKKSISLNNITNINQEFETSNEINQNQTQRYSLMEKKRQKWNQDKLDSNQVDNWPYGKPGPGAGRVQVEQDASLPPQPPQKPKKKEALDEYNRIKEQIQAIEATESKIKQEQQMTEIQNPSNVYHDQSKVPAAMRTSILFGGVLFDDDIKKTKELERKKWLQELENQKKEKLIESQRTLHQPQSSHQLNTSSIGQPINSNQFHDDDKSFARTRNLLDPAQIEDMERKRKQNLLHKQEIEAQIAEKKRIKMLEEEIQALNNIKIENEARELKETSQMHEEIKKNQTHLQNFEKILNSSRANNNSDKSILPSVLQGEVNKFDQEKNSSRNNVTETRSQEIYRKMQEAELAAAEEKHKKLLKRLQKGGHDTTQLERKFAELKAKLTGNPSQILNTSNTSYNPNPISNIPGLNLHTIEQNRSNNNASQLSVQNDHELKLERQKQLLTQKILNKENESKNEQSNTSRIRQIFQLLREDTNGLPAELTDEDLKLLLKNVVNNKENTEQTKKVNNKKEVKQKIVKQQEPDEEDGQKQSGIGKDGKPIWNYKNLKGKKAIPNSMKDPFYNERAKLLEERRKKRLEYYQNQTNKVSEKQKEYLEQRSQAQRNYNDYAEDDYHRGTNRQNLLSSMSNTSNQSEVTKKQKQPESIMNLLTKNLASNPIYEEDEDLYLNREEQKLKNPSNSSFGDGLSNRGFVPFMRTNEVLDPAHAGSPIPPSRESSAVKRDREKARQSYIQNMRPADYGNSYDEISDRYRKKDPLFNNGLVRNNPTPRQEQILSQLATLKQSLIQKQKEIASSIQYDNNDNYD